jgi:hypothetical protein
VTKKQIKNCIREILEAPCDASKAHLRILDLSRAISRAAASGEEAAHSYLVAAVVAAWAGRYIKTKKQEQTP